jgi:hypothetical protein
LTYRSHIDTAIHHLCNCSKQQTRQAYARDTAVAEPFIAAIFCRRATNNRNHSCFIHVAVRCSRFARITGLSIGAAAVSINPEAIKPELMAAAAFAADLQTPSDRFAGRGIVICAGGARLFTCAWVCIALLRGKLGCTLPIEVWHLGPEEMGPAMRSLLEDLGAQAVDAFEVAKRHQVQCLGGWELKTYALMHSRFREVLLLDADNVPVKDPSHLFEQSEFQQTGAIFWPDIVRLARTNPIWSISGLPFYDGASLESGQMVLDKSRCWRALSLAHWMNQHSDAFYEVLYGDKDTFLIAWLLLGQPFHTVRHKPKLLDFTLCQRDRDGSVLFQHRNSAKWILRGSNPRVEGFRLEDECLELIGKLRRLWDGRVFNPPARSERALRLERRLAEVRDFRFVRVSSDERCMELLSGHRIGTGASGLELYWWVADGEQGPELILEGDGYRSCALRCSAEGVWRGEYLLEPAMPVELFPDSSNRDTSFTRSSESDSGHLASLLDRILEAYESLPWDAEVMRDFTGTVRTLATLEPAVAEHLHSESELAGGARLQLVRQALTGLAEPASKADRGGIAPGHRWLNQNFNALENAYEGVE